MTSKKDHSLLYNGPKKQDTSICPKKKQIWVALMFSSTSITILQPGQQIYLLNHESVCKSLCQNNQHFPMEKQYMHTSMQQQTKLNKTFSIFLQNWQTNNL